jgi:lipopolysaccharide export system permease protein
MLQNKIYHNFFLEIFKTFFIILFGLSVIALTVRAVSFLDLIVENGYSVSNYFKYSFLNLFGITPKFFPLAFLLTMTIFITKHLQDSEFIILWTSGVKKIQIVNLLFFISILVLLIYLILAVIITPYFLNKSRLLLSNDNVSSFLPTIKRQQFSDTFKNFTFFVENKNNNQIENIFLFDEGNKLKSLTSNNINKSNTAILAKKGLVKDKKLLLFNGQIITSKKNNTENEIITFEQINIDLSDLNSATIKKPKLQETSTLKLLNCFIKKTFANQICENKLKEEITSVLNRRIFLPLYIPVLSLICCLQLIKSQRRYLNKFSIFVYSFILVLFAELTVRLTGINILMRISFIILPFILTFLFYSFLLFKFSKETKYK